MIQIELYINHKVLILPGFIGKCRGMDYLYGFELIEDEEMNKQITEEIKKYSLKHR
ncbi:hypothetical protein [Bacillus massilioanorexius]|uniref:hypothetical protein n=1 Tax=Bacillus massilioanorexius TaxID=1468413 RepID=UPI0002EF1DBD|nr:hypothetical protein [Bacillus massilioanorexius]